MPEKPLPAISNHGRSSLTIHDSATSSPIRDTNAPASPIERARPRCSSGSLPARIEMNTMLSTPRTSSSAASVARLTHASGEVTISSMFNLERSATPRSSLATHHRAFSVASDRGPRCFAPDLSIACAVRFQTAPMTRGQPHRAADRRPSPPSRYAGERHFVTSRACRLHPSHQDARYTAVSARDETCLPERERDDGTGATRPRSRARRRPACTLRNSSQTRKVCALRRETDFLVRCRLSAR